ncbi:hypothetical protein DM01DRAFT_1331038 [Hesseltinella vesiculosa]|uniref:Uncharacterized protein n=1 Tax=Hesseltinella vesiculosa TaxID=101127 RepID=A0A1X2GXW3_9FUNG|nr:hypothetical protein DM01DRAFT_1331038 [Hesseltinella vesiculosa]
MQSRQYRSSSRPPGQVIAQNERTLRHQKRLPGQKQPSRLHHDDHCPHGKRRLLQINAKKPVDAFVTYDALDSDVFVCNAHTRNRALECDLVAIQHPARRAKEKKKCM